MPKTSFFIVKEVEVTSAGKLVPFEFKLPGNVKYCIGYQLSANRHHDAKSLATVGISFNGARENSITKELIVRNPVSIRRRQIPLLQRQRILKNAYIKGYVEDNGVVTAPYKVKIYLHLLKI